MRMLMQVRLPNEPFNSFARKGELHKRLEAIVEQTKPEVTYFCEFGGRRVAIMIVHPEDPSAIPQLAEPWFLQFNAEVEFHIVMTPEEVRRADVDALGKKSA